MKKFLITTLALLTLPSFAFAQGNANTEEVLYQAEEITDENELFERAINNVHEVEINESDIPRYSLEQESLDEFSINSLNDSSFLHIDEYSTSQILSEKIVDGELEKEIAVTVFADVQEVTPKEQTNDFSIMTSGDKGGSAWDSSRSVLASSRIYYTLVTHNGVPSVRLTRVSGSWSISDSSVRLENRNYTYGQSGANTHRSSGQINISSNSFNTTTPSSWAPAYISPSTNVGVTSRATLRRGTSSTWSLTLTNNY